MMQKVRRWETITPILPPLPLRRSICIKTKKLLFDIQCTHFYNHEEHCCHYLKRFLKRSQQCSLSCSRVERSTNTDFFFLSFIPPYTAYFDGTISFSLTHTHTHTFTLSLCVRVRYLCVRACLEWFEETEEKRTVGWLAPSRSFFLIWIFTFFAETSPLFLPLFFRWDVYSSSFHPLI